MNALAEPKSDRRTEAESILNLHRRMDTQDKILLEIRDSIVGHLAKDAEIKPALDELVSLWKGSKVISRILAFLIMCGAALWALFVWAKDHIK